MYHNVPSENGLERKSDSIWRKNNNMCNSCIQNLYHNSPIHSHLKAESFQCKSGDGLRIYVPVIPYNLDFQSVTYFWQGQRLIPLNLLVEVSTQEKEKTKAENWV